MKLSMKKTQGITLILLMMMAAFAGCIGGDDSDDDSSSSAAGDSSSSTADTSDSGTSDSSDSSDMQRAKDIAAAPSRPQLLRRVLEEIVSGRSRPEWLLVQHLPALAIDGHANNEDDDGNDGTGQFHT